MKYFTARTVVSFKNILRRDKGFFGWQFYAREFIRIHFYGPDSVSLFSHDGFAEQQDGAQCDPNTLSKCALHTMFHSWNLR